MHNLIVRSQTERKKKNQQQTVIRNPCKCSVIEGGWPLVLRMEWGVKGSNVLLFWISEIYKGGNKIDWKKRKKSLVLAAALWETLESFSLTSTPVFQIQFFAKCLFAFSHVCFMKKWLCSSTVEAIYSICLFSAKLPHPRQEQMFNQDKEWRPTRSSVSSTWWCLKVRLAYGERRLHAGTTGNQRDPNLEVWLLEQNIENIFLESCIAWM